MDVHHLYFPRREYKKEVAREFRNLEENQVYTCRNMHNIEHAVFDPPQMPDMSVMREAVQAERERRKQRKS